MKGARPLAVLTAAALILQPLEAAARVIAPITVAGQDLLVLNAYDDLACKGDGTNPLNGQQSYTSSAGQGNGSPALPVDPTFHSGNKVLTAWGLGWSSEVDQSVSVGAQRRLTWLDGAGNRVSFAPATLSTAAPVAYHSPVSLFSTMTVTAVLAGGAPSVATLREPDGTTRRFELFESSSVLRLSLLTDKNGSTVQYQRDGQGRVTRVEDVHGRYFNLSYNGQGLVSGLSDSGGRTWTYGYDGSGRKVSETGPNGSMGYVYDGQNRMTRVDYPNGGVKNFFYDSLGRVQSENDGSGQNAKTYAYYASSTTVTDALGHTTVYAYVIRQGLKKPSRVVDANGGVTTYGYDGDFNLVSQTDPRGNVTHYSYDSRGNVVDTQDAALGHTLAQYEAAFNQLARLQDPLSRVTLMSYDAQGNLSDVQDPQGGVTHKTYDAQGHVLTSRDPLLLTTQYGYTASNGALASVTDPENRTTALLTDPLSRVTKNTDPAGKVTEYGYDAAGNLTQVKDALGGITSYGYIPGRDKKLLETVTDAKGHTTTFGYDAQGRLTATQNALGQTKSSVYDAKGNLTQTTNARGQVITYEYDALDRLTKKTLPEGDITYAYDAAGNMTDTQHYNGSRVQTSYDALNRVTQVVQTLPGGYAATIGYGYDAVGNRTSMTTPWGNFSYVYDTLNRLTSLTNPQSKIFTFQYDANGRRTKLIYPNGIETTYTYDDAGQVLSIIHERVSDHVIIAKSTYSYDAAGNRLTMTDLEGTHSYEYDDLHRLTRALHPATTVLPIKDEHFSYDAVGNRLADSAITGYTYDNANRLLENSSFTYTYDADGNRTRIESALSNAATNFAFSSDGLVIGVARPNGENWDYQYDRPDRRVEKSTSGATTSIERYVYDAGNLISILDGANNLKRSFTMNIEMDEPIAALAASGTERFFHADALGNIRTITSSAAVPIELYSYQAFGEVAITDSAGFNVPIGTGENEFLYTGKQFDFESRTQRNGYRYLDSVAGTFISDDPSGSHALNTNPINYFTPNELMERTNLTQYAASNPLKYTDSSGLLIVPPIAPTIAPHSIFTPENRCPDRSEKRGPRKPLPRGYFCALDTADPGKPPHIVITDSQGNVLLEIYPPNSNKPPRGMSLPQDIIEAAIRVCGRGQFLNPP